jgi:CPA1 family monovalent cation:H+ antiporter
MESVSLSSGSSKGEVTRLADDVERHLRQTGPNAERDELRRLARARQIDEETARKLIREIDLQELR